MRKLDPQKADVLLRINRQMLNAISGYAVSEGLFSRAAAIRELLTYALDAKVGGWRDTTPEE